MNSIIKGISFCFCVVVGLQLFAEEAQFEQGVHFQKLTVPVQSRKDSKIEVVEVFSYACVHCYNFDPEVNQWHSLQSEDVGFRRSPAVFSKPWEALAQAYFTAEILGVTEQVHMPIFSAIHQSGARFRTASEMATLFKNIAGVDEDKFISIYNSFGVRSQVQQAGADGRMYRLSGVPAMVVAGKYVVDGRMAGNNSRMLAVVDYLVQLERDSKKSD